MANERANLLSLIADFKAALARQGDDGSDSDESELAHGTNRGQKLKRKSKYVHEGALDEPAGPKIYEEEIDYAGKKRKILYRKRRREDSDEDTSDGDDGKTDDPRHDDPYRGIHIDKLLAPPTAPSDIPNHPVLSLPYKSRTLNELTQQSLDIICSENKHTTVLRKLLDEFLGDESFVNLEKMEGRQEPGYVRAAKAKLASIDAQKAAEAERKAREAEEEFKKAEEEAKAPAPDNDVEMEDKEKDANEKPAMVNGTAETNEGSNMETKSDGPSKENKDGGTATTPPPPQLDTNASTPPPTHRMTTRSANNPPTKGNSSTPPPISPKLQNLIDSAEPWFFPPPRNPNARDFGLNPVEAEETRRLLLLAVQKEEEFIRGLQKVREGLLRADRFRTNVWDWCRSDGQEPLSDGEDWVDLERWGLEPGELKKGVEEEEEDDPKRKTTRGNRRGG